MLILAPEDWPRWLGAPEGRFPAERMECWKAGKAVGIVCNDQAELPERVAA